MPPRTRVARLSADRVMVGSAGSGQAPRTPLNQAMVACRSRPQPVRLVWQPWHSHWRRFHISGWLRRCLWSLDGQGHRGLQADVVWGHWLATHTVLDLPPTAGKERGDEHLKFL